MSPFEETVDAKQFALMLSSRISEKTGLPEKYFQAIRLMDKYGGHILTNDNPNYKKREMTKAHALDIIALISVPKKQRKQ